MSDTSSDDILDGLVEDVEENLNESDVDEEVDVDEDILEALEGDLAEQASDADEVTSHCVVNITSGSPGTTLQDSGDDSDDSDDESEFEAAPGVTGPQPAVDISVPVINFEKGKEYGVSVNPSSCHNHTHLL